MAEHLAELLAEERMATEGADDEAGLLATTIQRRDPGSQDVLTTLEEQILCFITEHFDAPGAPVPVRLPTALACPLPSSRLPDRHRLLTSARSF